MNSDEAEYDFSLQVSEALKRLISKLGMSRKQFAEAVGIPQPTFNTKINLESKVGWNGSELKNICGFLQESPLNILLMSGAYDGQDVPIPDPVESQLRKLAMILNEAELRGLISEIKRAQSHGVYHSAIAAFSGAINTAELAKRMASEKDEEGSYSEGS